MSQFIDRRVNAKGKSVVNQQRFMRRYKAQVRRAVADAMGTRTLRESDAGGDITIPARDLREPTFSHGPGGRREYVLPGNKDYVAGDEIARPRGGQGGGAGSGSEPGNGQSEDEFRFTVSREEFLDYFFEDMELPYLVRKHLAQAKSTARVRAGYQITGPASGLSVIRTMRQSLARRMALSGGAREELERVELALLGADLSDEERTQLEGEAHALRERIARVAYLDDIDLRYRHHVVEPRPVARAVMFCLMDVSASMTREFKDLAKRYYTLLYLFLTRQYEQVEIVFIRHTEDAQVVDEQEFFHGTASGGTRVASALELMLAQVHDRFARSDWNIYGAQCSDGDAFGADPAVSAGLLAEKVLPLVQYFTYIEVGKRQAQPLARAYEPLLASAKNLAIGRVIDRGDIFPVMKDLFGKKPEQPVGSAA